MLSRGLSVKRAKLWRISDRNHIYELAYTFTIPKDYFDLLTPRPPPTAQLLLTCRQMAEEAKSYHEAARMRFWSDSKFTIQLDCKDIDKIRITAQFLLGNMVAAWRKEQYGWPREVRDEDVALVRTPWLQATPVLEFLEPSTWVWEDGS